MCSSQYPSWSIGSPAARYKPHLFCLKGKLCAVGGEGIDGDSCGRMDVFDPRSGCWIVGVCTTPHMWHGCDRFVVIKDVVHYFSGRSHHTYSLGGKWRTTKTKFSSEGVWDTQVYGTNVALFKRHGVVILFDTVTGRHSVRHMSQGLCRMPHGVQIDNVTVWSEGTLSRNYVMKHDSSLYAHVRKSSEGGAESDSEGDLDGLIATPKGQHYVCI
ncbi:hypothetical protein KIPB_005683 [Kipferlia bialata]|uniref:Uncharacterized protein n=1 Tax=Kipferlia bialata TaxID=797122 RepID=A0A9K3CXJ3_9EUKA|nr:hypothetical protein KIPB_005683 [Kipferlia bialata]|eukprot:g5683.t1